MLFCFSKFEFLLQTLQFLLVWQKYLDAGYLIATALVLVKNSA